MLRSSGSSKGRDEGTLLVVRSVSLSDCRSHPRYRAFGAQVELDDLHPSKLEGLNDVRRHGACWDVLEDKTPSYGLSPPDRRAWA